MISKYELKLKLQNKFLIPFCRRNRFLSNFYYCFFSNEFAREHQKVLNGKHAHYLALKENKPNEFFLRREIHRLEKGLIMKDRRAVFALDYISGIVKNYKILCEAYQKDSSTVDIDLIYWANCVVKTYFNSVDNHPVIEQAKQIFNEVNHIANLSDNSEELIPFIRSTREYNSIGFEDLYKLAWQRRSVRWFLNKEVSRELIEKAISIGTLSPSACNRQPFEFRIFDVTEKKNLVGSVPMGIKGFYTNVPVFIVVVGKLNAYLSERDRHVMYIDCGLASMAFMFALETLGLSSMPINWPDIEALEKKMEKIIHLKDDERPLMLIGVGYADPKEKIPYSQKKSPGYLIRYNQ
jgi:nitroreductase